MNNRCIINLAKNFTLDEFLRSSTAEEYKIFEQWNISIDVLRNLRLLATHVLQPLRDACGAVIITSAYRCEKLNKILGGAENSQHMTGQAADIRVKNMKQAINVLQYLPCDQVIIYDTFIHVSYDEKRSRKMIINYQASEESMRVADVRKT